MQKGKWITSKLILSLLFFFNSYLNLHAEAPDYNDVQKQLWLSGKCVVNANYSWYDAVNFIDNDPRAIKSWGSDTSTTAYCSLVHAAPWGRVWTLGFFDNLNILFTRDVVIPLFDENDYVLIPFWSQVSGSGGYHKSLLRNARFPQNFYFLGNSDQCTELLRAEGVQAFTVSHNAFIDPNHFQPVQTERLYDAVYAGCCRPQKRLNLASLIFDKLLVVTHSNEEQRKSVTGAKTIVINPPQMQLPSYISQAHCGIILSAAEGGCYGSTEYLYCGVPVVSTKSIGGREAYYDEVTAIVVEDTPEAVREGVKIMRERAPNPLEVRRRALAVSDKMLNTLAYEILQPIFEHYRDPNAKDPRGFVNAKMQEAKQIGTKGRTVFQPENPTHNSVEKIKTEIEQKTQPNGKRRRR